MGTERLRILYVEPFEGGSHARFTQTLTTGVDADWTCVTLPGRHWKWRMRGAAPWAALARRDDVSGPLDLVWASSFVNLAELFGLLPHLAGTPSILFFHENQFAYPERAGPAASTDLDFGYVQMVSALAATRVVFNSAWNRDSFLDGAAALLARLPDAIPPGWVETLRERTEVLPIPMDLPDLPDDAFDDDGGDRSAGPVILWNHRWEHDKGPDVLATVLRALAMRGVPFRLALCGQSFREVPPELAALRTELGDRVVHWGTAEPRSAYEALLRGAHIALSTARQEFFGMALLEAVWHGARPLAPARLSYPELLPEACLYPDDETLPDALAELCRAWCGGAPLRADRRAQVAFCRADAALPRYEELLRRTAAWPA
jgi:glycosyltransferase involved in cell wall biosynthesis